MAPVSHAQPQVLVEITTFQAQCLAVAPTTVTRFWKQYCDQEFRVAESSQVGDSTSVPGGRLQWRFVKISPFIINFSFCLPYGQLVKNNSWF
ncbi:hypothetical protein AVEN_219203-1 [Araneus ventricosus]|uniref:Uncharacterized protein n=1 Tax=Araneus ventricosus TaxID=182803 RepID=A0A4Y2HVP5_ARAVE|nr:hypothetical protein AVEN_219203-1 [Araneus ventricosus]